MLNCSISKHVRVLSVTSTKQELLEHTYRMFQGQPAAIAGSLVSADLAGIDEFNDVDVFFNSSAALHYALGYATLCGYELDTYSKRKMGFTHRWGNKPFHVETYRLNWHNLSSGISDHELNISFKVLGGKPLRGLSEVLLSFDFGFLLAGYDCLAPTFEDSFLDLRPAYFPEAHASGGPYPLIPQKGREWMAGNFGQNNGIRSAHRLAKYAERGYDMSAIAPQMLSGYEQAAYDLSLTGRDKDSAIADIYLAIVELIKDEDWEEIISACDQLGFNEPIEKLQEVFD